MEGHMRAGVRPWGSSGERLAPSLEGAAVGWVCACCAPPMHPCGPRPSQLQAPGQAQTHLQGWLAWNARSKPRLLHSRFRVLPDKRSWGTGAANPTHL